MSCSICPLQTGMLCFCETFEHEKVTGKPGAVFMSDAPTKSRLLKLSRKEHYPVASFPKVAS